MTYEDIERERYEDMWSNLKGRFSCTKNDYRSKYPEKCLADFVKFLGKKRGKSLDVGCGNGRNSIYLAKKGFDASCIDISKSAANTAKKHAKDEKVKFNVKTGSVFDLPYKKDSFDVIIDSGCLHHLRKSEWKKYRGSILRVLKKGGYYYLHCFSITSGYRKNFRPKKRNWSLRGMHYNHFFTRKEIDELFGKDLDVLKEFEIEKDKKKSIIRFRDFFMRKK